jgi:hypothetical protein
MRRVEDKRRNYFIAGGVLFAVAVAWFLYSGTKETTCKITAAGMASVVAGVTHGRDVAQILATAASGIITPKTSSTPWLARPRSP